MASKVPDFDLADMLARGECVWPMCFDRGTVWLGRCYDGVHLPHCGRHHAMLISRPEVYAICQPGTRETMRWDEEGGYCG